MNTVLAHTTSHPPIPLAPLGTIDRIALRLATGLISWVEQSRRLRTRHEENVRERQLLLRERALLSARLDRDRHRVDSALLFRNLA